MLALPLSPTLRLAKVVPKASYNPTSARRKAGHCTRRHQTNLQQAEDVAHEAGGLALQPAPQARTADIHAGEPRGQQLRLLRRE